MNAASFAGGVGRQLDILGALASGTIKIAHPCDTWAQSAGYDNWHSAVTAMKEGGKVLAGAAPQPSKSTISFDALCDAISKAGLHSYMTEFGQLILGLRANFPQSTLDHQARELEALRAFVGR
ncbi:hypothetical protein ABIC83_002861 [Roseateles asaccharophilus]|uniref:hypothetical protein n=1 Tax=Roseateles asaccharophilus TaxID=582607 RepID=UPI0038351BD9